MTYLEIYIGCRSPCVDKDKGVESVDRAAKVVESPVLTLGEVVCKTLDESVVRAVDVVGLSVCTLGEVLGETVDGSVVLSFRIRP